MMDKVNGSSAANVGGRPTGGNDGGCEPEIFEVSDDDGDDDNDDDDDDEVDKMDAAVDRSVADLAVGDVRLREDTSGGDDGQIFLFNRLDGRWCGERGCRLMCRSMRRTRTRTVQ
jgi:hypothetical protein